MFQSMPWRVSVWGTIVLFWLARAAAAQGYPAGPICQCVQPVVQQVYQTVPVTEYRPVKQTVQRPVVETKYVERQFTEYRPVTEAKTVDVPTVTYQNVTEYRTVQRDYGRWMTQYHPIPRLSPCDYDKRADLAGWLNRTGYSLRTAFLPQFTTTRHYVPNVVAYAVPVTRRVAMHGTQKMTYNVTRLIPHTATRKVAVNTVRYVTEVVTAMRPVTVMRTVPIGSRVAYAPFIGGATQTALQPIPDRIGRSEPTKRTANRRDAEPGSASPKERFQREPTNFRDSDTGHGDVDKRRSSMVTPNPHSAIEKNPQVRTGEGRLRAEEDWHVVTIPTAVRVHRWTARNRTMTVAGPTLIPPSVAFAGFVGR